MIPTVRNLRVVLVDDEPSALRILRGMIMTYCSGVDILAEVNSAHEAVQAVRTVKPDVVFLDIEMPPFGTGFDFLQACPPVDFGVIFTTAYSKYAVEAINAAKPWYYLLKPYTVSSVQQAVQAAFEKVAISRANPEEEDVAGITIRDSRKGNTVLRFKEIVFCEADGATCIMYVCRREKLEKIPVFRTLKEIEQKMPSDRFFRTHHKNIVNMAYIDGYKRTGRNGIALLKTGQEVNISVQRMEDFERAFENFLSAGRRN